MSPLLVEVVGAVAAVLTTLCWLPQTVRVLRLRDARAISLSTNVIFAVGISLWLVYGIALQRWPIILANAVTLVFILALIGLKLRIER